MITDIIEKAISDIESVIDDEKSINCVSRNRLNKARAMLKLANDGIRDSLYLDINCLYETNKQFRSITNSFLTNRNNEHYCFYFLADEAEKIITIGRATPVLLHYVLDDIKDRYEEIMNDDKSNSKD